MAALGSLVIAITGTTAGLQKAATKSQNIIKSIAKTATSLPALIGGAGAVTAAVGLAKVADSYTLIGNQLAYATGNATEAEKVQRELYNITRATGSSMKDNTKTYLKLNQAQELTGLSSEENLQVLGGLIAIMQKTGTSGAEASNSMLQLGQALTSGNLGGDEFKSLGENAPGVLNALAESLGVTRGELKLMSTAGELTSKKIGTALVEISQSAESSFDGLAQTAEKGMNHFVASFQWMWDQINDNSGIMKDVHDMFLRASGWLEENSLLIEQYVIDGWAAFINKTPEIIAAFGTVGRAMQWFGGIILKAINGWQKLIDLYEYWRTLIGASDDLFEQRRFVDRAIRDSGYTQEQVDAAANSPRTGTTQINNFNQQLSRSDITNITTDQQRQAARL